MSLHIDTSAPVSTRNDRCLLIVLHFNIINAPELIVILNIFTFGLRGQLLPSSGRGSFPAPHKQMF